MFKCHSFVGIPLNTNEKSSLSKTHSCIKPALVGSLIESETAGSLQSERVAWPLGGSLPPSPGRGWPRTRRGLKPMDRASRSRKQTTGASCERSGLEQRMWFEGKEVVRRAWNWYNLFGRTSSKKKPMEYGKGLTINSGRIEMRAGSPSICFLSKPSTRIRRYQASNG